MTGRSTRPASLFIINTPLLRHQLEAMSDAAGLREILDSAYKSDAIGRLG
jgi:hypothetical protein